MSPFIPTREESRKYSDYTVEVRESPLPVSVRVIDGRVCRMIFTVRRVPSTKTFILYIKGNATPTERKHATQRAHLMPFGYWAEIPDRWWRRQAKNRVIFYEQKRGYLVGDPLLQLELEMMIDLSQVSA